MDNVFVNFFHQRFPKCSPSFYRNLKADWIRYARSVCETKNISNIFTSKNNSVSS